MTDKQKNQITEYREQGMSYTEISKKMDLSINTIRWMSQLLLFLASIAANRCNRIQEENRNASVPISAEIYGGIRTWTW